MEEVEEGEAVRLLVPAVVYEGGGYFLRVQLQTPINPSAVLPVRVAIARVRVEGAWFILTQV